MTPDFVVGALVSYLSATCNQIVTQVPIENDLDTEIHSAAIDMHGLCKVILKTYPGLRKGPKILRKYYRTYVQLESIAKKHRNVEIEPIFNFYLLALEELETKIRNPRKSHLINLLHQNLNVFIQVFDPSLEHNHHFELADMIYIDWQDMIKNF